MPIRSMTGFAQVKGQVVPIREAGEAAGLHAVAEIGESSLSRSALSACRPNSDSLEMKLRRVLKEKLARGHVEVTSPWSAAAATAFALNRQLVGGYVQAFRAAAAEFGLAAEPDLNAVLRLPGALDAATVPADGALEAVGSGQGGRSFCRRLNQMRDEEGRGIERELRAAHGPRAGSGARKWRNIARLCCRPMSES